MAVKLNPVFFALAGCIWSTPVLGAPSTPAPVQPKAAQPAPGEAVKTPVKYVDLRTAFSGWGLPIKSQGRRDTCAVFTFTGALEYALARGTGQNGFRLSEEYLNWAADQIAGEKIDGASYEELLDAFDEWGIAGERFLPYAARYNASLQPTPTALASAREIWKLGFKRHWVAQRTTNGLTDAHINEMRKVLASGWPLCAYGHDHSILIVGFFDDPKMPGGGQFITRNSATQRYETIFYEAAKSEFGSVLWIELVKPEKPQTAPAATNENAG